MARILVIEDDDQVRDILQETLEEAGYEVVVASDGADGIAHFRENHADLVITDILMPIVNGVEAIRELRKDAPDLKIIAITGVRGRFSRLPAASVLGAQRTFTKPFSLHDILAAVREMLGGDCASQ